MRRNLARAIVISLLSATGVATAFAATLGPERRAACSSGEGKVLGYMTAAGHACSTTMIVGLKLFRTETVRVGSPGQLTFRTLHLNRCIEFRDTHGSADVLFPSTGIAIKHLKGKTLCRHLATDAYKTLTAPGATMIASGTILGIDSSKKGSTIKVFDGVVVATSTRTRKKLAIKTGFEAFFPLSGAPQGPRPADLDDDDRLGAFLLQHDIVSMGPPQPAEYLRSAHQNAIVVVGQDAATTKRQAQSLKAFRTAALTADQVSANPKIVITRAKQIRAQTVVVAGSFDQLKPLLQTIADELPATIAALYVP